MSPAESTTAGEPYFEPYLHAGRLVEQAVAEHAREWAAKIAVEATESVTADIRGALHACLVECIAAQTRPHHRPSGAARDYDAVVRHAAAAAGELRLLQAVLDPLPVTWRDPDGTDGLYDVPHEIYSPLAMARELESLAAAARRKSTRFKAADRGGPTKRMRAFTVLAKGLIPAYRRATSCAGTGHSAREGELREFVEAVLPVAQTIAMTVTGKPLEVPTGDALGEHLNQIARKMA